MVENDRTVTEREEEGKVERGHVRDGRNTACVADTKPIGLLAVDASNPVFAQSSAN